MKPFSTIFNRPKFAGLLVWFAALAGTAVAVADEARDKVVLTGVVVDEAEKPVAGVVVRSLRQDESGPVKTETDGRFQIKLKANPYGRIYSTLLAVGDDGKLGLLAVSQENAAPVKVVLKPSKALEVRVVDRAGQAVAGAEVAFLTGLQSFLEGRTNTQGLWTLAVPADAKGWGVIALKAKLGFDYSFGERARGSTEAPLSMPSQLTLTLDGARPPLRVKTVDLAGKPLVGVQVGPWLISKPGHETDANLGGSSQTWVKTGDDGFATIDWLPASQVGKPSIIIRSDTLFPLDHATWLDADKPVDEVIITLLPFERLSGQVKTADGRPAEGVRVEVEGQGSGDNAYHGIARTDAEGRYSLRVHSEHAYLLTASRGEMTAPYKADVIVRAGKPVEGVDLTLGKATKVRGRVTVGNDQKPVEATYVSAVIARGEIPKEIKRADDRYSRPLTLRQYKQTDQDGRFAFDLGSGEYSLQGPARTEPVKFTIPVENPPVEIVRNFTMPRPETGPFQATVVDAEGKPVAGAAVAGMYASTDSRGWFTPTKTNAQGFLSISRSLDPLVIHVETMEKTLGAVVRVDAEATEARIVVKPTATASGRLVDPSGDPIAHQKLRYDIRVVLGPTTNSPFTWTFGGAATTDDQGRFTAKGLVVGEKYDVVVYHSDNSRMSTAKTKIVAIDGNPTTLVGDVEIDLAPPKPYVPPTVAQRTNEAFAAGKERSPREKLDYVLTEGKREYTRPLLLFGSPKDPVCVDLFRLFNDPSSGDEPKPKNPGDLRWEFELASLDGASADVETFTKLLGVPTVDGKTPMLAVLSADGKLDATYPLRLAADGKLDSSALAAFLLAHKLPTRDAEAMLADGLAKAKAENKRVFLIMSASWCGPCRLLARFLVANKGELDRHYVFVKLDISRDTGAESLRNRFKEAESGGVPWYVILDDAGQPLITSNDKELDADSGNNNVGFPSSKEGIAHFLKMIKQTAPRLSDEALTLLGKRLSGKP